MSSTRSRSTSRRKKRSKAGSSGTLVSRERKKEILGLILLALAFLVTLAILTHSREDDALLGGVRWDDLFDARDNRTDNLLGPVGAIVSRALVPGFLGFPVLGMIGMLFGWGYVLFRRRTPVFLPMITGLTAAGVFFLACFLGWIEPRTDISLDLWGGAVGLGVAGWLEQVMGAVGSFALLILALAITTLLLVERDIQASIDRFEKSIFAFRDAAISLWRWIRGGGTVVLDDIVLIDKNAKGFWTSLRAGALERKQLREAAVEERKTQQEVKTEREEPEAPEPTQPAPLHVEAVPPPPAATNGGVSSTDDELVDDLLRKHQSTPPRPGEPAFQ
ncbi:MAG: DNA translocase FtsK 4TM domain-containing protein, partial [Bacteroidetes bacterium]|nr:DNA translocase FtsK 4TM domain-containing protein [Bacteroidota bacterium]